MYTKYKPETLARMMGTSWHSANIAAAWANTLAGSRLSKSCCKHATKQFHKS